MTAPTTIRYKNWRGETADRTITPTGRVLWTSNEWHPEPQWLLEALDARSGEVRLFALSGIRAAPSGLPPEPTILSSTDHITGVSLTLAWPDGSTSTEMVSPRVAKMLGWVDPERSSEGDGNV